MNTDTKEFESTVNSIHQVNGTSDPQTPNTTTFSTDASADDSNEESVEQWLLSSGLSQESCSKLVSNGYKSMSIFEMCNENDIESISDEFNLKTIEKLKLKTAINKLLELKTDSLPIIDPKERNAMIKMQEKINSLEQCVDTIQNTLHDIDKQNEICTKLIDKTFATIHSEIDKRKTELMAKLQRMVSIKKRILSTQNKKISKNLKLSNKIKNDAHKLLNDSNMKGESKKQYILKKEKEILALHNTYNGPPKVQASLVFDFESDYHHLLHTVHSFGNITNDTMDQINKKQKRQDAKDGGVIEHWDHETIGDNMKVLKNKSIVLCEEKQSYSYRSCFGVNIFDEGTHHWQLMIKQCNDGYCAWNMLIGVMKIDNKQNQQSIYRYNKQTKLYHRNSHFSSNGYGFVGNLNFLTAGSNQDRAYGCKFKQVGDIIDVYLDLSRLTLSYRINGIGYGVAYTQLQDTKYCLAVSFCGVPNELELVKYDNETYK